ncbi:MULTISPECIES: Fpg/Nei family DNA glycosylase [Plantibacter]|uniref:DNA-(apurinic or apyrimidinic site) lyase n=1 Tax=Plantibacter flavus TaxID=150123 RepID=A0A3N2C217_9MICO|nr:MULTISPECIES: DNA-formamidopyrimidine glycosylase family protein [Plantibacter]MBD8102662.1 Fpg/Nei family DNA glycosylase [Plantibacter sp. CFBP 8775]ROR81558.1 endonuclease-8 [Plantibacter flavus]SMG14198.1 endonuclease-8 [Plantibacter flavus]VXC04991.1 Formamidopyrimidine-DNA glycosylase [Plantibacter sp. T3]
MPEGHSVHRIARQFAQNFVGHRVSVSSPQGRFAEGAAVLDGRTVTDAKAVGKQMFLEFDDGLWLRVHLGLYGAWDFAGEIRSDPTIAASNGRMGQTNQRGTVLDDDDAPIHDADGENSLHSIGAPRRARVRMSEQSSPLAEIDERFPPEPVGQVRVRLLTETTVADLRGPTACEVIDAAGVQAVIDRLGPDPLLDPSAEAGERFVSRAHRKGSPIGLLLMDQQIISGIGNVYRAELLFRARLDPHRTGKTVPVETLREIWLDWTRLLAIGVETGQMMTMDDLSAADYRLAMANRADRHWVYKREGLPCRVCGTNILLEEMGARKLYWCPNCQR